MLGGVNHRCYYFSADERWSLFRRQCGDARLSVDEKSLEMNGGGADVEPPCCAVVVVVLCNLSLGVVKIGVVAQPQKVVAAPGGTHALQSLPPIGCACSHCSLVTSQAPVAG